MNLILCLLALCLITPTVYSDFCNPIKALVQAPYNLRKAETVLALKSAILEGAAAYRYAESYLLENARFLSPPDLEAAADALMEHFCPQSEFLGYFSPGFIGPNISTDLNVIKNIYINYAVNFVVGYHKTVDLDPIIQAVHDSEFDGNNKVADLNFTAFYNSFARVLGPDNDIYPVTVIGRHIHMFRALRDGRICIRYFNDVSFDVWLHSDPPLLFTPTPELGHSCGRGSHGVGESQNYVSSLGFRGSIASRIAQRK